MNIFLPQSIQTQTELKQIASVRLQIISPTDSKTANGTQQDGLIGGYNMTNPNLSLNWRQAMNLISITSSTAYNKIKKGEMVKGSDLYSMIIPDEINLKSDKFKVKRGEITQGRLTDKALGAKEDNTLIQLIWNEYGEDETAHFIDNTRWLNNAFNLLHGFSVGYGDVERKPEILKQIRTIIETKKLEVQYAITEIENNPDLLSREGLEAKIFTTLKGISSEVDKLIAGNLSANNGFKIMEASGSKGKASNVGQMMGCLGQKAFEGAIIPKRYNRRTLPFFHQDDDTAASRGLVENSFYDGLNFVEFFYLLVEGRSGLIDSAVKSVTGDTPIIVLENGEAKYVEIGDWIDGQMEERPDEIEHYVTANLELLKLKGEVYIPTCDKIGNTSWGKMSAITRHDPGTSVYEFKTETGRNVIVAESQSLIIWNENKKEFEMKHSPEIEIGNCVPVTMNLTSPKIIKKYVDMTKYFPKTEYIYGTDFWACKRSIDEAMDGRERIPMGWWEKNNGKTFILPYPDKAKVTRALGRSKMDSIKEGCIYPYAANREPILLPEKFELNEENGIFIGLFLADGNVDLPSGYIQITKKNEGVKNFIRNWFKKHGIKYKENKRTTDKGTIEDIRGFSTLFARFLDMFVGHGALNKYIPYEAYTAPDDFVKGLLNGYFSGDGTVGDYNIEVVSISKKLIDGTSLLCNRFGIFGKIRYYQAKTNNLGTQDIKPTYTLSIKSRSIFGKKFVDNINLINNDKNAKLQSLKTLNKNNHVNEQNDVILDKIVEINKLGVEKYPKLYDVSVPATGNFGIANGITLKNTAETGYMQRKLVKSFEDIMVKNDGTVRNANNNVVQFVYGDSGANTITQYAYDIGMLDMNNEEIGNIHRFTDQELKKFSFNSADNNQLYDEIIKMKNGVFTAVQKAKLDYQAVIKKFMIPVNMNNILEYTRGEKSFKVGKGSDLTPKYILDQLQSLLDDKTHIICMTKKERDSRKSFKYFDEQTNKLVLKAALYDAFSPKRVLLEYGLNKSTFDKIIDMIVDNFRQNMVEHGEMVGVIAATGTGEPLTQMNLKAFHQTGVARTNTANGGVPRMKEIFSVSKNPKAPEMRIYLDNEIRDKKDIVHKIKSNLKNTVFSEVRKRINGYYDPNPSFEDGMTKKDKIIPTVFSQKAEKRGSGCNKNISNLPWLLRVEIDREKMAKNEIKLVDITSQLCNWLETRGSEKDIRKEERKVLNKIVNFAILSNRDNDKEQIIHIRFNVRNYEKDEFDKNTLNDFINYVLDKFKIKGIDKISDIPFTLDDKTLSLNEKSGEIESDKEYVIITSGVNLTDIRYMDGINLNKTISNDIKEVYNIFGIEIARSLLMTEIANAYKNAGGKVNDQLIQIIVDQMTMTGTINSIDRHGLNKSDADPFSRASFEKPVEQLWASALFGEVDNMNGVSSRIMAGECIKGGTGYNNLILNTDMILQSEYREGMYEKKYDDIRTENVVEDILNKDNDDIFVPI